jgi:hypothetical protein
MATTKTQEKRTTYQVLASRGIYVGGHELQDPENAGLQRAVGLAQGEEVELGETQAQHYLEIGAIGKPGSLRSSAEAAQENEAAQQRIAELEAELQAAKSELEKAKTPPVTKAPAK